MARKKGDEEQSSSVSDNHAELLYRSLEQYNQEQKRRKQPSFVLAALITLFLSSAGGISLAIVLMLQPTEMKFTCISRDLVLFASAIALLYICLHVRGAKKNYRRKGPGPPQVYGQYLHASALLIARLAIAVWIAALVATAVMVAKPVALEGFAKTAPYLNLVICVIAIPSSFVISASIESNPTPFATKGVSRASFLNGQSSQCSGDLIEDLSVSRRASLQRKESNSASIATVPTAEIFQLGSSKTIEPKIKTAKSLTIGTEDIPNDRIKFELMANSPIGRTYTVHAAPSNMSSLSVPRVLRVPPRLSKSPPQPVYNPGAWRTEWNDAAEQPRVTKATKTSIDSSSTNRSTYSSTSDRTSSSSSPSKSSHEPSKGHRATPSTSITSSANRSRLSTVRYASQPEVAIRQAIRVVKNPNYTPGMRAATDKDQDVIQRPEPAMLSRSARETHGDSKAPALQRKPSNFSRPLPPSRGSEVDSAIEMKMPATFIKEQPRT
ncbi:uncharacterized protein F4812DRAFT_434107 [Daldinia caldariorum]|uniref:uncharacterized protein n=1 Tax=Daldinia caldariorum TaxID=326644 RepID=UPI00200773B4|nr:uncharacterized protein F4812DRAFT_434107 [Daldinia caldariorum]KAI1466454.1 hypothetical protein F4812DRAFT_434107 [Daldinia caldariorum]